MPKFFKQKRFNYFVWTPVSSLILFPSFATIVVDIGVKFAVLPVLHLDLRIYPGIFDKIRNDPDVIFRGLGEDDS
jgi:hypothetical protein